jgi:hypothetical protein
VLLALCVNLKVPALLSASFNLRCASVSKKMPWRTGERDLISWLYFKRDLNHDSLLQKNLIYKKALLQTKTDLI